MIGMWKNSAMPLTNMWWAQTMKLITPMLMNMRTASGYANSGLRAKTGTTSRIAPRPGSAMM